jgi:hypothetical protein
MSSRIGAVQHGRTRSFGGWRFDLAESQRADPEAGDAQANRPTSLVVDHGFKVLDDAAVEFDEFDLPGFDAEVEVAWGVVSAGVGGMKQGRD